MTAVRVARVERRTPPGPIPDRYHTHALVLADDAGGRELPILLPWHDGVRISAAFERGPEHGNTGTIRDAGAKADTAEELTRQLLHAAGARMTGVDIDELGPGVPVARIGLAGPDGSENVIARLPDGLAIAVTAGAPIRVADAVMDRLAVPASPGTVPGLSASAPERAASELSPRRPRYEPRNMTFAEGLSGWLLDGSFREHPEDHWAGVSQGDEAGIGGVEPAAAEIERAQMIFEVDVQPLAACRTSAVRGDGHEPCPDPASADPGSRQGVEQEGVDAPVPGNVDEAHQLAVFPRADPAQAVPAYLGQPIILQEPMTKAFSMQGVQLRVGERAAPRVIDHRATLRSDHGAVERAGRSHRSVRDNGFDLSSGRAVLAADRPWKRRGGAVA